MKVNNKYTLEDYLNDKQANVKSVSTTLPGNSGVRWTRPMHPAALSLQETATERMNAASQAQGAEQIGVQVQQNAGSSTAGTGSVSNQNVVTKSDLTTVDVDERIGTVLQELFDFGNRKFKYNAKESPLYTILQQQAAKEARLASGRAYSRVTANTGGFGSSYATVAAEEAGRQVMEGLDDQQLALYQAAKEEWDSQFASKMDEYNFLVAARDQVAAREKAAATGMTEGALDASQYLRQTYGTTYSEGAMRNDLLSKGVPEDEVNAALEAQRKFAGAVVLDYNASDVNTATQYAAELDASFKNGYIDEAEYNEKKAENSKVIMGEVDKWMKNINHTDYASLGIDDAEWQEMGESERKLAMLDALGQKARDGAITASDYYNLLYEDIKSDLTSSEYTSLGQGKRLVQVMDTAMAVKDFYDNGYISKENYEELTYDVLWQEIKDHEEVKTYVAVAEGIEQIPEKVVELLGKVFVDGKKAARILVWNDHPTWSKETRRLLADMIDYVATKEQE